MKEVDILKIVSETFDEEISSSCSDTILGLMSSIDGKDSFMQSLKDKLNISSKNNHVILSMDDLFSAFSHYAFSSIADRPYSEDELVESFKNWCSDRFKVS